jgi:3-dehydroquinate synthase
MEHVVPAGEGSKSLPIASQLYDTLVHGHADRKTVVVALGGGVVSDLAGFVAATFARGIDFVPIPTTLLAMVDASVGGKVAIDHPRSKNIIGAFHQPRLVWCHTPVLKTLSDRSYRSGLVEAIKHGLIFSDDYLSRIEMEAEALLARDPEALSWLVSGSVQFKARIVAADERELTGQRAILNLGHTFGHALETAAGYRELEHGEAVSIGLCCAARLARRLDRVGDDYVSRVETILRRFGLPTTLPDTAKNEQIIELMRGDKKSQGGSIRFILPTKVGHVELVPGVSNADIGAALDECRGSR